MNLIESLFTLSSSFWHVGDFNSENTAVFFNEELIRINIVESRVFWWEWRSCPLSWNAWLTYFCHCVISNAESFDRVFSFYLLQSFLANVTHPFVPHIKRYIRIRFTVCYIRWYKPLIALASHTSLPSCFMNTHLFEENTAESPLLVPTFFDAD